MLRPSDVTRPPDPHLDIGSISGERGSVLRAQIAPDACQLLCLCLNLRWKPAVPRVVSHYADKLLNEGLRVVFAVRVTHLVVLIQCPAIWMRQFCVGSQFVSDLLSRSPNH